MFILSLFAPFVFIFSFLCYFLLFIRDTVHLTILHVFLVAYHSVLHILTFPFFSRHTHTQLSLILTRIQPALFTLWLGTPPSSCISNMFLFCVLDSSTFCSQYLIPLIFPSFPLDLLLDPPPFHSTHLPLTLFLWDTWWAWLHVTFSPPHIHTYWPSSQMSFHKGLCLTHKLKHTSHTEKTEVMVAYTGLYI